MKTYVKRTLWASDSVYGSLIYVLYSDMTYEVYKIYIYCPCHKEKRSNGEYVDFKKYMDLGTLKQRKFTKEEVDNYIRTKAKDFLEEFPEKDIRNVRYAPNITEIVEKD